MKICTQCKKNKSFTEFHKDNSKQDKLARKCKNCKKIQKRSYYLSNKKQIIEKTNKWRAKNKIKYSLARRKRQRTDEYRTKIYLYRKNRRNTDIIYRITQSLRSRIVKVFRGFSKSKRTTELLGCSVNKVFSHIESLFQPGMTWENYGEWHIDHIIPLASAKTKENLEKLCHYTNLQPLWALDNIIKSDTMPNVNLNESPSIEEKV